VRSFYASVEIPSEEREKHVVSSVLGAIELLSAKLEQLSEINWTKESIALVLKEVLADTGLKMPQLAMPVRVLLMGTPQTPSLDAVIALFDSKTVLERLRAVKN